MKNGLFNGGPLSEKNREAFETIFTDSDETLFHNENEAGEFMDSYIDENPDVLTKAVITADELADFVIEQMNALLQKYLNGKRGRDVEMGTKDDFNYARFLRILGVLRQIVKDFEIREGNCYFHLCGKGCKAVRAIRMKL